MTPVNNGIAHIAFEIQDKTLSSIGIVGTDIYINNAFYKGDRYGKEA